MAVIYYYKDPHKCQVWVLKDTQKWNNEVRWKVAYCQWWTPKWWRCRQRARHQRWCASSSASLQKSLLARHPLRCRTVAPPLCVVGKGVYALLRAVRARTACPGTLSSGAPRYTCSCGSCQSCSRGVDRPGRLCTAKLSFCGIFDCFSRSAADMWPTPAPRPCAGLTAHILRGIGKQNIVQYD